MQLPMQSVWKATRLPSSREKLGTSRARLNVHSGASLCFTQTIRVLFWARVATSCHWFVGHVHHRLAGKIKPTTSQLKRLLGARKHMVRDLIEYMPDKDGSLVKDFVSRRKASVSETDLDTYPSDGSVPQELLDAMFTPQDPNNLRGRASSSYTSDRRESEAMDAEKVSSDEESSGDSDSENDAGEDGRAYIIDAYAVVDSSQDTVTSSLQRPSPLRKLGDDLDMNAVAAAETALRMSKYMPEGNDNVLVVPHGSILSDFHNNDAWVKGFVHLFPEGCADPDVLQA